MEIDMGVITFADCPPLDFQHFLLSVFDPLSVSYTYGSKVPTD